MSVATAVGYWMAVNLGMVTEGAALVLGVSISVASTVVLLRGLMDPGALKIRHLGASPSGGSCWKTWLRWRLLCSFRPCSLVIGRPGGTSPLSRSERLWRSSR